MIFKKFLIEMVLSEKKTQTRRLKCRYKVSHIYPVDHKRFQSNHDGHIQIKEIRREYLADISPEDVLAEGFEHGNPEQFVREFKEINKKKEMEENPYLYVIIFQLVKWERLGSMIEFMKSLNIKGQKINIPYQIDH